MNLIHKLVKRKWETNEKMSQTSGKKVTKSEKLVKKRKKMWLKVTN